ncbi:MAG TPA: UrcA family protein [Steroidobacteraceae bacterium]|jgi:UrcA family protein|nr:UrcA family protein [Steroidobacteraceae bacterium]
MNCNIPVLFYARASICAAAVAACAAAAVAAFALLSGPVQAKGRLITVQMAVSTAGLDLAQPVDAGNLYGRLSKAAHQVCDDYLLLDVPSGTDPGSCYERALANAVRSAHRPQLTLIYLKTHTLQDAAKRGIDIPTLVVAN